MAAWRMVLDLGSMVMPAPKADVVVFSFSMAAVARGERDLIYAALGDTLLDCLVLGETVSVLTF